MEYFLIVLSSFLAAFRSILSKDVNKRKSFFNDCFHSNILIFIFGLVFLVLFSIGKMSLDLSSFPFWLPILYGITLYCAQLFLLLACRIGPVGITATIYYSGFILTTIFGTLYANESINVFYIIAFLLIAGAIVIFNLREKDKKFSIKWLVYAIICFFSHGSCGICQKVYSTMLDNSYLNIFLIFIFATASILSILSYLFIFAYRKNKNKKQINNNEIINVDKGSKKDYWLSFLFLIIIGVALGGINLINSYTATKVISIINFPLYNAGVLVFLTLLSYLVYKEKLNKKQILGLVLIFVSIGLIVLGLVIKI